jgi:hypothetical protein
METLERRVCNFYLDPKIEFSAMNITRDPRTTHYSWQLSNGVQFDVYAEVGGYRYSYASDVKTGERRLMSDIWTYMCPPGWNAYMLV